MASTMALVSVLLVPVKVIVMTPPLGEILLRTSFNAVFEPTLA